MKIIGPQGNDLPDEEPRLYEIMGVARKERGTAVGARKLQVERLSNSEFAVEKCGRRRVPK